MGFGGWTALHHACHMGRHEAVELLLSQKADMEVKNNEGGGPRRVILGLFYECVVCHEGWNSHGFHA